MREIKVYTKNSFELEGNLTKDMEAVETKGKPYYEGKIAVNEKYLGGSSLEMISFRTFKDTGAKKGDLVKVVGKISQFKNKITLVANHTEVIFSRHSKTSK